MFKPFIFIAIMVLVAFNLQAQPRHKDLFNANEAYKKGEYKQAEKQYREVLSKEKLNEAAYNLGNALYEQKSFSDAAKQFESTAKNSSKPSLKANAFYNEGNAFLSEKKYEEAIASYKKALRENPAFNNARYNLAYAQAMLKKQTPPPPKNQENKQDKNKQEPDQDKNDSQKKNKNEEEKQEEKNKQESKENESPKPQPGKLSKSQADELLNALQREEKKVRERKDKQKGHPVSPEKDW